MYILNYRVRKTVLLLQSKYDDITPGNMGYLQLVFDFDEDWVPLTKTVLLYQDRDDPKPVLLGEDNTCEVPWEFTEQPLALSFGLRGDGDGQRVCTNMVAIKITPGIYVPGETPSPPTVDIYQQIINTMREVLDGTAGNAAVAKASAESAKAAEVAASASAVQAAENAEQTGTDQKKVADLTVQTEQHAAATSADRQKVAKDKSSVDDSKAAVEEAAALVGLLASEVAGNAEQVAINHKTVAENTAAVSKNKASVEADTATVKQLSEEISDVATQVTADRKTVTEAQEDVLSKKETVDIKTDTVIRLAGEVASNAEQAEASKAAAAASAKRAEDAASSVTRYGVRFSGDANTGETVTRLYNAVGLVAGVGTDTQTAVNDFDNHDPWKSRRRACGYYDASENFVVNAYEGEPGYATDGSNGMVMYWTRDMYIYDTLDMGGKDGGDLVVSTFPFEGYRYYPGEWRAAYQMATVDGKATSQSGVFSDRYSLDSAMASARTLGDNFTTERCQDRDIETTLMMIEFATRNLQAVMMGATNMTYVETNTATVAETVTNRVIVAAAVASKYVLGQTIGMGTSLGNPNIANNRIVTAIEEYDADNYAISFDGSPVDITIGSIVGSYAWINGSCDGVLSSSGSPVSNTNGRYNCIYRGKETPYGNALEWVSDVLINRNGEGTTEAPYTFDIYFLPDPTKYQNGTITADYIKLNYQLPDTSGYVKNLGFDSRYPYVRLPITVGGSTTTYYSDNYTRPTLTVCAACVGSTWSSGLSAGPFSWNCGYAPSYIYISRHARLSYHAKGG